MKTLFLLTIIILLASVFRFTGLNWDQNNHLHPDERFLTMVALAQKWPSSFSHYLDTSSSTLNPHNVGYEFYVYGTFPLIFVKFIAQLFNLANYNQLTLIGRAVSGIFDLGTLVLIFLISKKLFVSAKVGLISTLFYSFSVLPIQLSHFYAVDTFLVFFLTFTFYFLLSPSLLYSALMGLTFGLAVSSKISALIFLPIILINYVLQFITTRQLKRLFISGLVFISITFVTVRLAQPYLFASSNLLSVDLNQKLIANFKELKSWNSPDGFFPPAVQWINTPHILFPLENLLLWGLGLPLGIFSLCSLFYVFVISLRHRHYQVLFIITWILLLFFYQGFQFSKTARYFYPIYPFLAITSGIFFISIFQRFPRFKFILAAFILLLSLWPIAFVSIYQTPHTRVTATNWMIENIPNGSAISCEYWDDCLPLGGSGLFQTIELHLYDSESSQKWSQLSSQLNQLDYLILSSNRLYGSIPNVPDKYPITTRFYQALFAGDLGFTKVAEFTSRPHLPFPGVTYCLTPPFVKYGWVARTSQTCTVSGISFVDDYADENFTVFDHPKVIIFQKIKLVDYSSLFSLPKK